MAQCKTAVSPLLQSFTKPSIYVHNKNELYDIRFRLTPKGSAFSHEICEPHDDGRTFSGKDSGTATIMNNTSSSAMAEARAITKLSL